MRLCVFQGTFNPIHNAHLRVADFVCKNFNIDKILFIPAYEPPHKFSDPKLVIHRYNMVGLAIENNDKFELSDVEYQRKGKSYTYLTILELYKKFKIGGKILFIIGTDAFKNIESWYKSEELKNLVKFIVFVREDEFNISHYNYLRDIGYDFELQNLPYKKISSTEFREKIQLGADISGIVPQKVKEYIEENGLYKN